MKKGLILAVMLAIASSVTAADKTKITFGFAQCDVTAPVGSRLACWKRKTNAVAVHDKLYAQCIALKDYKQRTMLFVGGDLMYFGRGTVKAIRKHCQNKYNIKPADIIFSGSHTHNAPYASGKYGNAVLSKLIRMLDQAVKNCTVTGSMKISKTTSDLGVSRRFHYTYKGRKLVAFRPYKDGKFDKALTVIAFYDKAKKLRNFVWIYGCHNTGYGAYVDKKVQISADWTGAVRDVFNQKFTNVGSLFMQGAGGDVKPRFISDKIDSRRRARWQTPSSAQMQAFGVKYGTPIAEFIAGMKNNKNVPVDIKSAMSDFKLTYDTQGPILKNKVKSRAYYQKLIDDPKTSEKDRKKYKRLLKLKWYTGGKPQSSWQCQKIHINNNTQILGISGEATSGVAELLYKLFKGKVNIFVAYTQHGSYITNYRQQLEGGYEAKGYGSNIDQTIINAFKNLKVK